MLLQVNVPAGTFLYRLGPLSLDRARLPSAYKGKLRSATNKEFLPVDRLLLQLGRRTDSQEPGRSRGRSNRVFSLGWLETSGLVIATSSTTVESPDLAESLDGLQLVMPSEQEARKAAWVLRRALAYGKAV
jgi:hypothetical protein